LKKEFKNMTEVIDTDTLPAKAQFTEAALAHVQELIGQQQNPALKLRVAVAGGGCSGFQYGFSFDAEQNPDDTVFEHNGVGILIDAVSYHYLGGAKIDFVDDLSGSRFVVDNPNATTTCGCGSSFSI